MKRANTSFEHVAEFWDRKVGDTGNMYGSKISVKEILGLLGNLKNKKIYEPACGNGYLARKIVQAGATEVFASDLSPRLIEKAEKYDTNQIQYEVRNAEDFRGLPKSYFDGVVIHQGIFYIFDLDALFSGIDKILKPGGICIFTILHPLFPLFKFDVSQNKEHEEIKNLVESAKKYPTNFTLKVQKNWNVGGKDEHVTYYAYKRPLSTYVNTLSKYGLAVVNISESGSQTIIKNKKIKSKIPSIFIVKAVKYR